MNGMRKLRAVSVVAFAMVLSVSWLARPLVVEAAPPAQTVADESIAGHTTADDLDAIDLGLISASGGPVLYTSDRLREEFLGSMPAAATVSTSDHLRDLQLGSAPAAGAVSTSDHLRDLQLGSAPATTPVRLHEEAPGATGYRSGR